MPVWVATILTWLVQSTLARVLWASVFWWFCTGLIPVVVGSINGLAGDPFALIPDGCWWILDTFGFDIWVPAIMSAFVVRFVLRRLPRG